MNKALAVFGWDQEPVTDRLERLSRRQTPLPSPIAAAAAAPALTHAAAQGLRDAPKQRDHTLSPLAVRWQAGFPAALCPTHLCRAYPRVANRLALCWSDRTLAELILADLLIDKRGGRKGFPPDVANELRRLRQAVSDTTGKRQPAA